MEQLSGHYLGGIPPVQTSVREDDWDAWDGWDPKRPSFGCRGLGWSSHVGTKWAGDPACVDVCLERPRLGCHGHRMDQLPGH